MKPEPTDRDRLWESLRYHRHVGLHTFDIRSRMCIGNPSQRIAELEEQHGVTIPRRREKRGRRMGVRYFHPDHAPADLGVEASVPPRPSDAEVSGTSPIPIDGDATESSHHRDAERAVDRDGEPEAEQLGLIPGGSMPSAYDTAA